MEAASKLVSLKPLADGISGGLTGDSRVEVVEMVEGAVGVSLWWCLLPPCSVNQLRDSSGDGETGMSLGEGLSVVNVEATSPGN